MGASPSKGSSRLSTEIAPSLQTPPAAPSTTREPRGATATLQSCNQNKGAQLRPQHTCPRPPFNNRGRGSWGRAPNRATALPDSLGRTRVRQCPPLGSVGRAKFRSTPGPGTPDISQHPLPQPHGLCGSPPPPKKKVVCIYWERRGGASCGKSTRLGVRMPGSSAHVSPQVPTGTHRPPPSLPDSRPSREACKFETTPLASAGTFARPPAQGLARRRRPDPARPADGKPGPWRRARGPEAPVPRSQCPGQVPMVRARRLRPGGCRQQALTAQGAAMAGPGAPEAPQEPEEAAAAVAARSVSAPPTAANSNAGRVPSPRPPRLKETRRLGYLLPYRKQSCRAGSTASAPTLARPGGLWTAPPKASGHRRFILPGNFQSPGRGVRPTRP